MKATLFQLRLVIIALGILLFMPFLGSAPLFDWDEINFAESAREMLVTGDFARVQINFNPFWEKPPLFIWMQAASMKLIGVNEYAARFPNALFGIITLITMFEIGRVLKNERFGILAAIMMVISLLPHIYFKSGIIDPVFNYFIFVGIFFLSRLVWSQNRLWKRKFALLAGLSIGLAILTKGPVAMLFALLTLTVIYIFNRFRPIVSVINLLIFLLSSALIASLWFIPETIQNGPWFILTFIEYQIRLLATPDAGHAQPFFYHFVIVLIGCAPMSVIALRSLFKKPVLEFQDTRFLVWMKSLFWGVLIVFSIVETKIVHYSSLSYLPLAFIAAAAVEEWLKRKQATPYYQIVLFSLIGFIPFVLFLGVPLFGNNIDKFIPYIKDPFAVANLQANVEWNAFDLLPALCWFLGIVIFLFQLRNGFYWRRLIPGAFLLMAGISIMIARFPAKISEYTQGAPMEFYAMLKGKEVYVETIYFKSYAQYFYTAKQSTSFLEKTNSKDAAGNYQIDVLRKWYLEGNIDKPAYFVLKTIHYQEIIGYYPFLEKVNEKNGFTLLMRKPAS